MGCVVARRELLETGNACELGNGYGGRVGRRFIVRMQRRRKWEQRHYSTTDADGRADFFEFYCLY
jgi:hypothetical protein